tara:strand:+ start:160 stop:936 length:777 start_codon:yes stop_codon:yes gene_type:complete
MITVVSPAKKLSNDCFAKTKFHNSPEFIKESESLINQLKLLSPNDLESLMGVSEKLAILNWERIQNWNPNFNSNSAREAVYSFKGDTYVGLDAGTLNDKEIKFAQNHLRILSGLYGVLRPLDLIMPYRLEMGTKFKNSQGENLYKFWGTKLSSYISKELDQHKQRYIINCASVEYFKSLENSDLKAEIITPIFKEIRSGKPKIISFFAKKARGMMARYIVQNQINTKDQILNFNLDGYKYSPELSANEYEPVFTREKN